MKRRSLQWSVVLSIALGFSLENNESCFAADDSVGLFEEATRAVAYVGNKAIHQKRARFLAATGEMVLEEAWISLEGGYSKQVSKRILTAGNNPLHGGIPADSGPYTHGLWVNDYGFLRIRAVTYDWIPAFAGTNDVSRFLSYLKPEWVRTYESRLSADEACCGDVKKLQVAPASGTPKTQTIVWDNPPFHRQFEVNHGLIAEAWTSINGVITERLINEFLPAIDLTPPPELQKALAALDGTVKATDVSKISNALRETQKPNFGLALAKIPRNGGIMVVKVYEGGPAHRAGVRPLDRIASIDGVRVEELQQHFSREISEKNTIRLLIIRTGVPDLSVTLEKADVGSFDSTN